MQLDASGITELDGIISVPATIAKHMIQDYDGLKVLKPATELEAAAKYADRIPVTRDHPDAGIVTDRGQVLGFLKNPLYENDELKGILEISNKDLAADVKDGKLKELSIGFFCNLDNTQGTVGDAKYDAIQKDIFLNHVAIVDAGRCSIEDGCKFHIDSKNRIDSPPDPIGKLDTAIGMAENDYNSTLKDLLTEIKEMVVAGSSTGDSATIIAERDALKKELGKIVHAEKDAIITELTTLQDAKTADDLAKLDLANLKKELDMVNELRTDRLSFDGRGHGSGGKSAVDDAYAKVGR
nr:hypothetical protein JGPBEILB_00001 [Methanosarcinales archaeon ANME-2c ERB4]